MIVVTYKNKEIQNIPGVKVRVVGNGTAYCGEEEIGIKLENIIYIEVYPDK
jgi:hypothetical protein